MSPSLSKSLRLSSTLKIEEEAMVTKKQGIVSILSTDSERSINKAASLRRTLSADMSSKKWLSQHGFSSTMKKTASSEQFPVSIADSSSDEEEDYDHERKETTNQSQFDIIWSSIQEEKNNKKDVEKPGPLDIWSSIISQKPQEDSKSLPLYIHPLVKRSASSLSEKSLEICTESLGSETGSDGFSSYSPSETGDIEEDKEEEQEVQHQTQQEEKVAKNFDGEDFPVVKYNYVKKMPQRSFPPPIPSLSRGDGDSLLMKSRRDNGRLVLEAVSVPSQNKFRAQRQDGRLVLTFANSSLDDDEEPKIEKMNEEEFEEEFENFEEERGSEKYEEEEEEEEETEEEVVESESRGYKEMRYVTEQAPKLSSGPINLHRLALMMNKPTGLQNRNPTWPNKFNEAVKFVEEEEVEATPLAQSLPPRPPMLIPSRPASAPAATVAGAAASFNAYEYYWRPKPMATAGVTQQSLPLKTSNKKFILSKNPKANEQQQLLVLRGNRGDYLAPLLVGCKESRRSLLLREPFCITI